MWFEGKNTSAYTTAGVYRCCTVKWAYKGEWGQFEGEEGEQLEGVGERLRWAQSSPERAELAPLRLGTHTLPDTFHCVS